MMHVAILLFCTSLGFMYSYGSILANPIGRQLLSNMFVSIATQLPHCKKNWLLRYCV